MSIEYILNGHKYLLSYSALKEEYYRFTQLSDEQFIKELPAATHFACVVCFLKEIPTHVALCDIGIVHELIHLMHIPDGSTSTLRDIRRLFEDQLKLL